MVVFPNAKINIGLNIVERREDGFHNIESCFYPVPWFDVLEVIEAKEFAFSSSGIKIPGDASTNLVIKAYELLKDQFDLPSIKVHLHKNIPIGAGLGGGSADAAFMIKLLNDKFGLQLSIEQQQEYAGMLGSDCPFFIENKPVYVQGTGNLFSPIDLDLTGYTIVVAYPEIHIGTKEAYAGVQPKHADSSLLADLESLSPGSWTEKVKNDFESMLLRKYAAINQLKQDFYSQGAEYAAMTGSGSAVFGLFKKPPKAPIHYPHIIKML